MTSNDDVDGTLDAQDRQRGEFFVVDRRTFAAACGLGLNPAVAYLAIARGAGSRPQSLWSVNAIERHTGISRPKAKLAVKTLIEKGMMTLERAGTRPMYGIVPAHELPGAKLPDEERKLLKLFEAGEVKLHRRHYYFASELVRRGYLKSDFNGLFSMNDPDLRPDKPQHIWLPNAIVEGAADETPPLALLRQMQDVRRLQLFVGMYDCHDLPNDGGISRALLYQEHGLTKVGQRGESTVWGFSSATRTSVGGGSPLTKIFFKGEQDEKGKDLGWPDFWSALNGLRAIGLLEFIPHVFESDKPEAEMLHAFPIVHGACEPWEIETSTAAIAAGMACLTAAQREWAARQALYLLPAPSHITNLAVIGIARLRYRPHTRMTAAWFAKSKQQSEAWQAAYRKIKSAISGDVAA